MDVITFIHSLLHSFATMLNCASVPPRVAEAALHSSIELTMQVYSDPRLLDIAAAVEALSALPIQTNATGT